MNLFLINFEIINCLYNKSLINWNRCKLCYISNNWLSRI